MNALDMQDRKVSSVITGEDWRDGRIKASIETHEGIDYYDQVQVSYRVWESKHYIDTTHSNSRLHVGIPIGAPAGKYTLSDHNYDYSVGVVKFGRTFLVKGTITVEENAGSEMAGSFIGTFDYEGIECTVIGEVFRVDKINK